MKKRIFDLSSADGGHGRHGRLARGDQGFALIATLSVAALVVLLVLALLSLANQAQRTGRSGLLRAQSEANARLGMSLAVAQLQKEAGPDQRITGSAGIQDPTGNPEWRNWTAVWPARDPEAGVNAQVPPRSLLLSGNLTALPASANPLPNPETLARAIVPDATSAGGLREVDIQAAKVDIAKPGEPGKIIGRQAWWVGDEGVKARVDLARPKGAAPNDRERLARSQSPMEPDVSKLGSEWAAFAPGGSVDKKLVVNLPTAALAAGDTTATGIPRRYFSDLTTLSMGLPASVAKGGMKADLSLLTDTSQLGQPDAFFSNYIGAKPTPMTAPRKDYNFTIADRNRFFLSPLTLQNSLRNNVLAGPNWGILFNYAKQWQSVENGWQSNLITMQSSPFTVETTKGMCGVTRTTDWPPYYEHVPPGTSGLYERDAQHINSPLQPLVANMQLGFRMKARPTGENPPTYHVYLEIKPVIGLWNPYNVAIKPSKYVFDWGIYPFLTFNYAKPAGGISYTNGNNSNVWLREMWQTGNNPPCPTTTNPVGGSYLHMETRDEVDFQPGELRLFSASTQNASLSTTNYMTSTWNESGAFVVQLRSLTGSILKIPAGYRGWFGQIFLQDTHNGGAATRPWFSTMSVPAAGSWFILKTGTGVSNLSQLNLARISGIWNGGDKNLSGISSASSDYFVPEPIISGSSGSLDTTKPTHAIEDLARDDYVAHVATWSFHLRTTTQLERPENSRQEARGWIDANPRAISCNSRWDGSQASPRTGYYAIAPWMGGSHPDGAVKELGDGKNAYKNRGLLAEGALGNPEPETPGLPRYQSYSGPTNLSYGGQSHVMLYDIPRAPLLSIGQFQHAFLSRYSFEPGHVAGNSYANPRLPLGSISADNFGGVTDFRLVDISHQVNNRLWDNFFFSSLGIDYLASPASNTSFDTAFDYRNLVAGAKNLPNLRHRFRPLAGDANGGSIDAILAGAGPRAPEAIAARISIEGAFNVNSTSKDAWKAVLSSMVASELPVLNKETGAVSWENPAGIRFNRFSHVTESAAYATGDSGDGPAFWQGWRKLSPDELDKLATEIVAEVKARGPFRSFADFVNRNPSSSTADHQRKGALQAALDRTINKGLPATVGKTVEFPPAAFENAYATDKSENQAAGNAAHMQQGDILQSLAPVLQARSDTFRIRSYGEVPDATGTKIASRTWCEALVQRVPDYMDPADAPHLNKKADGSPDINSTNQLFGRRFRVVSFRWLSPSEI